MVHAQYIELTYVLTSEKWLPILQEELSCDQISFWENETVSIPGSPSVEASYWEM